MEIVKSGTKVFLSKINEIIEFCNGINIPDISGKADKDDTYTKSQVNSLVSSKADSSNTYTKSEVDYLIQTNTSNAVISSAIITVLGTDTGWNSWTLPSGGTWRCFYIDTNVSDFHSYSGDFAGGTNLKVGSRVGGIAIKIQ